MTDFEALADVQVEDQGEAFQVEDQPVVLHVVLTKITVVLVVPMFADGQRNQQ